MKRKLLLSLAMMFGFLTSFAQTAVDVDKTALVKTDQNSWVGASEMAGGTFTTADGRSTNVAAVYKEQPNLHADIPLKQVVTGLENGNYTVKLHGKVQTANWNYTVPSDFVNGGTEYAQVYALSGESKVVDPVIAVSDRGWIDFQWHTINVTVTDGTLELGLELLGEKNYVNWLHIQIKSLTWHTTLDKVLASEFAALDAKIAEAEAVTNPTAGLTEAIANAKNVKETATTPEEIQAAIAALTKAITLDANTKLVAGATPLAPVATTFIQNGTFDTNGVTAPWKSTTGAQNQTTANNQSGAFTGNFFENWNGTAFTGKLYQTVENIPNGTYKLQICAFVNTLNAENQYVYANADKTYLTAGDPTAYEVYTVVTDNNIEVGLELLTSSQNWVGIDNVKLLYCGEGDVKEVAQNAGPLLALIDAYNAANDIVKTLDAAGKAKFNELTTDIKSVIDNNTVITAEESAQMAATLNSAVLQAVAAQTTPGSDMTLLLTNAAVASGEGWTHAGVGQGEAYDGAPDGKYLDFNHWGQDAYAEKDMFQTISLPAGVYQLKAATRASAEDSNESCIYAIVGSNKVSADVNHDGNNGGELGRGWSWTTLNNIVVGEPTEVQIGFHAKARMYGWVGADNFRLTYVSRYADLEISPSSGSELSIALENNEYNNLTINLAKDGNYTISQSIVVPAGLVINGNGATIDASGLEAPFIAMSKTPAVAEINNYFRVGQIKVADVNVKGLKNSIYWDNSTKYCIVDFTIDNCVFNLATEAVQNEAIISMKTGGIKEVTIKNSTFSGNGAIAKYFIRWENNARLDRFGYDTDTDKWCMTYLNNTFYNLLKSDGQWGNYTQVGGKAYMKFDVQNNIWYNCGDAAQSIIRRMAGGSLSGSAEQTFLHNTYFVNDVENSATEKGYDKSETILTTDPGFVNAAEGDFTISAISQQAKFQTGDPRWLVEYDAAGAAAKADMAKLEALQADLTQFIAGKEEYITPDVNQAIETLLGDSWAMSIQGAYDEAMENNTEYVSPDIWTTLNTQIAWVKEQINGVMNGTIPFYTIYDAEVYSDEEWDEYLKCSSLFEPIKDVNVDVCNGNVVIRAWAGTEGYDVKVAYEKATYVDEDTNEEVEYLAVTGITPIVNGVEGETVTTGPATLYMNETDYYQPYVDYADVYVDVEAQEGYVCLPGYKGANYGYYLIGWPQEEESVVEPITEARQWDFTTGAAHAAAIADDTENWTLLGKGRYKNAVALENAELTAGGEVLEMTAGLLFTAAAENLLFGTQSGNLYLQYTGGSVTMTIPNCKAGYQISIDWCSSGKNKEAKLTLENAVDGEAQEVATTSTSKLNNVVTVVADGDVKITGNANVRLYGLLVADASTVGINNVNANTVSTGAIYNLAGQKVSSNFKGIVVKNGKAVIVK